MTYSDGPTETAICGARVSFRRPFSPSSIFASMLPRTDGLGSSKLACFSAAGNPKVRRWVHFLSPNTTSVLQPCDVGIIRTLKAHLRHEMRWKAADAIDSSKNLLAVLPMLKRIHFLDPMFWSQKPGSRFQESRWRKGGFIAEVGAIHLPPDVRLLPCIYIANVTQEHSWKNHLPSHMKKMLHCS